LYFLAAFLSKKEKKKKIRIKVVDRIKKQNKKIIEIPSTHEVKKG